MFLKENQKDIENRTWPCPKQYIGERVLIHAAQSPWSFKKVSNYLTNAMRTILNSIGFDAKWIKDQPTGAIIGSVRIVDCVINHSSAWAEKSLDCKDGCPDVENCPTSKCPHTIYNWVLAYPILFPEPIPVKGKLGFWNYDKIHAEQEEDNGPLFCHCQIPVWESVQVMSFGDGEFRCRYCGGKWYK